MADDMTPAKMVGVMAAGLVVWGLLIGAVWLLFN